MKVEFVGEGSAPIKMQINGDTGSNYTQQRLRSQASSVSSASVSDTSHYLVENTSYGTCGFTHWLYPQSGQNRPSLNENESKGQELDKKAFWWNNTADEITSMKIYASNTNLVTGTIRISVPKGTKMASPSAILTVN